MEEIQSKRIHAGDIEELPAVMEQAPNVCRARHVTFDNYLKLFDPGLHEKIRASAKTAGVTHVVCFECVDMWSSMFSKRTSMIVGEKQSLTLEKILSTPNSRIGDLPSRFQYPVAYAAVPAPAISTTAAKRRPAKKKKK